MIIQLKIDGMMCDACVGHVTRALQALPGVESAAVSLADNQAQVAYDPAQASVEQMISAVEEEGYRASRAA